MYTQLAIAYQNLNDNQNALKYILIGEQLSPNDPFNVYHKTNILYGMRKY